MRQLSGSITITYVCDGCNSETAAAPLPDTWRRVVVDKRSGLSSTLITRHFGPTCLVATDLPSLEGLRDAIKS